MLVMQCCRGFQVFFASSTQLELSWIGDTQSDFGQSAAEMNIIQQVVCGCELPD